MQRVVVGVDGSNASQRALQWAGDVAGRATMSCVAIMVLPSIQDGVGTFGNPALECSRQLEVWCAQLPARCTHHQAVVANGDPASILLDEASQRDSALLVVASRGVGELAGVHVGTVVRRLVHRTTIPLAIVGPTTIIPTTRLVVGHHRTRGNAAALAFTTALARRMAIPVTAVYTAMDRSGTVVNADVEQWLRRARADVHAWSAPIERAGVDVDCYVDRGHEFDPVAALQAAVLDSPGAVAVVEVPSTDVWGGSTTPLSLVRHSHHAVILVRDSADNRRLSAPAMKSDQPSA